MRPAGKVQLCAEYTQVIPMSSTLWGKTIFRSEVVRFIQLKKSSIQLSRITLEQKRWFLTIQFGFESKTEVIE